MMRFPTTALFLCLLGLVGATFTDPTQWPGFSNLPLCVQSVFPGGCPYGCTGGCIPCDVGCGTWTCACSNFFAAAISAASSVAANGCSTSQANAIASATSIVNGFCNQLLATPTTGTTPSLPSSTGQPIGGGGGSHTGSGLSQRDTMAIGVVIGLGIGLILAVY